MVVNQVLLALQLGPPATAQQWVLLQWSQAAVTPGCGHSNQWELPTIEIDLARLHTRLVVSPTGGNSIRFDQYLSGCVYSRSVVICWWGTADGAPDSPVGIVVTSGCCC